MNELSGERNALTAHSLFYGSLSARKLWQVKVHESLSLLSLSVSAAINDFPVSKYDVRRLYCREKKIHLVLTNQFYIFSLF